MSCPKKEIFRELIAAIFHNLIKTYDIEISISNLFLKEEVKIELCIK